MSRNAAAVPCCLLGTRRTCLIISGMSASPGLPGSFASVK